MISWFQKKGFKLKISFIVPTYNRAHIVFDTIESIIKQPYKSKEIIIIDDASTDNLESLIANYDCDYLRYFKCNKNRGQNHARNLGIEKSTAEIVTIMDSDDQDYGNDLTPIVEYLKNNQDISSVFTPVLSQKNEKILSNIKKCNLPMGFPQLLDGTCSGEYQPFFRKEKLPKSFYLENLNIKRSCTLLSYFDFFQKEKFTIIPIITKLYNDVHEERLGNFKKINKDAKEIVECYSQMLSKFEKEISITNKEYFNIIIIKISYYILLSEGRKKSFKYLINLKFHISLLKLLPPIIFFITLGNQKTIQFRRFFK